MRHRSIFWFLTAFAACLSSAAFAENYSPSKVIAAMKVNNPRLRIIVEHRGRFSQGCPENSLCAINQTSEEGVEGVEIDVRESADGTLWPIHDTRVGRTTNYSSNGRLFDPYHRSTENDRNNPEISALHDGTLRNLKIRDSLGSVTGHAFQDLETMIRQADIRNRNLVFMFDIKTTTAIGKVASMIKRLGLQSSAILKFNSTLVTPGTITQSTQGLNFVPVIGTGSLDAIADHYHLERRTPGERINAYINDFARTSGFVYFEVRNKMFKGASNGNAFDTVVEGPLREADLYMAFANIPQGGFAPFPEHSSTPDQPGSGYYYVDGYCCQRLTDHSDTSRYFGSDTRDDRENLNYMIGYNSVIISEIAAGALATARRLGGRQEQNKILY